METGADEDEIYDNDEFEMMMPMMNLLNEWSWRRENTSDINGIETDEYAGLQNSVASTVMTTKNASRRWFCAS
jgi:hypothetical protein